MSAKVDRARTVRLPAELVLQVSALKERNADERLVAQLTEMGVKVAALENENRKLKSFLRNVVDAANQANRELADPSLGLEGEQL